MARGQHLRVDASQVERIGGLGLQVLLAAKTAWTADGTRLMVENMTRELSAGLGLLGVQAGLFTDGE
jgi:chemotaxis protein CheX